METPPTKDLGENDCAIINAWRLPTSKRDSETSTRLLLDVECQQESGDKNEYSTTNVRRVPTKDLSEK